MSFGAVISTKDPGAKQLIKALQRAVDFATKRGVLVVAAAGNDGHQLQHRPQGPDRAAGACWTAC